MFRLDNNTRTILTAKAWAKKMAVDTVKAFGSDEEFAKALAYEAKNKKR